MWGSGKPVGRVIRAHGLEWSLFTAPASCEGGLKPGGVPSERKWSRETARRLLVRCSSVETGKELPSVEGPKSNDPELAGRHRGQDHAEALIASDGKHLLEGRPEVRPRACGRLVNRLD